jgi:hypothetical protein
MNTAPSLAKYERISMLETYRPLIERALSYTGGVDTWDDVCAEVQSGRAMALPSRSGRSIVIAQPMRDLHFAIAAGTMEEIMAIETVLTARARVEGFDRMTLLGRPGWARVLGPRGWKLEPVKALVKEL